MRNAVQRKVEENKNKLEDCKQKTRDGLKERTRRLARTSNSAVQDMLAKLAGTQKLVELAQQNACAKAKELQEQKQAVAQAMRGAQSS